MDLLKLCVLAFVIFDATALDSSSPVRDEARRDSSWTIASKAETVQARLDKLSEQKSSHVQKERKTIVGGIFSPFNRFPYMASIQYQKLSGNYGHVCGGSLIAPDFVLSVAHCFNGCHSNPKIIIGDHDLTNEADGGEEFEMKVPTIHPDYDDILLLDDIMLFQLSGSSTKTPVRLNKNDNIPKDDQEVDVIGWGATDPDGEILSDVLKETTLEVYPNDSCYYPETTIPHGEEIICAADLDGTHGEDSCQGDSGGPLIVRGSSYDEDILVGLVSKGPSPCAPEDEPGQYSRISYYYDWITNVVCQNSVAPPSDFGCPVGEPSNPVTPSPAPTIATSPSANKVALTLGIRFDKYANEVNWRIYKGNSNTLLPKPNVVAQSKLYSYYLKHKTVYEHLYLEPDQDYILGITDCFGDGICCEQGNGYYFLHWGHEEDNFQDKFIMFNRTGDYGGEDFVPFSTANNPVQTEAPTEAPTTTAPTTTAPTSGPTDTSTKASKLVPTNAPTNAPTNFPTSQIDSGSGNTVESSSFLTAFVDSKFIPIILCIINFLIPAIV